MKILVTGADGQVGWELQRSLISLGTVMAVSRAHCDLMRPEAVRALLRDMQPEVIVNAAAYTDVERAEDEEAAATTVNGTSVGLMADEAKRLRALLVHYSTDYVFDGAKSSAYLETDLPRPLSAYGRSKLAGETAIESEGGDYLIMRTSWVYSARRNNFVRAILQRARKAEALRVVDDQHGTPNWARTIAQATGQIVQRALAERRSDEFYSGIYHLTASGATNRYEFARAILAVVTSLEPDTFATAQIIAVTTADHLMRAVRPKNSQLDGSRLTARFKVAMPDWGPELRLCLQELARIDAIHPR